MVLWMIVKIQKPFSPSPSNVVPNRSHAMDVLIGRQHTTRYLLTPVPWRDWTGCRQLILYIREWILKLTPLD